MAVYDLDPNTPATVTAALEALRDSLVQHAGKSGLTGPDGRALPLYDPAAAFAVWAMLAKPTHAAAFKLIEAIYVDGDYTEIHDDSASRQIIAQWLTVCQPARNAQGGYNGYEAIRYLPRSIPNLRAASFWAALESDADAPTAAKVGTMEGLMFQGDPRIAVDASSDAQFVVALEHEDVGGPLIRELCRQWQAVCDAVITLTLRSYSADNVKAFWTHCHQLAIAIDTIGSVYVSKSTASEVLSAAGYALDKSAAAAGEVAGDVANVVGKTAGAAAGGFLDGVGLYGLLAVAAWYMLR